MKKNISIIILILCLTAGALLFINRDLFHYEEIFIYRRTFDPKTDGKGDYILSTEQLVLKPGTYRVIVEGEFTGSRSGFFLIGSDQEKIIAVDFPAGSTTIEESVTISGSTKQLRFGVSWDPSTGALKVDRVTIRSNHVLYKDSLYKHAVMSAAILLLGALLILRFAFAEYYRRIFPHISRPENERMLLMIIFLTLLTAAPFYRSDTYVDGDDFYYHMRHLKGIAASLKAGHFPARILLDWLENYGYGSGFYYPNIFLTFPALLILCGFHVIAAYEIFTTICTFFALLTMFLTIRRISSSEKAAHAGIILYAFAAYRLIDTYYRAALGEIQSFVFLPLIILGLYEIFNDHTERWWIFAISFTGLLCCHVISLALAGLFTALWLLFCIRRIFSDRKVFFAMLKAVLLTLALGAWFILPMLEQSATNKLKINAIMASEGIVLFGTSSDPRSLFLFFHNWDQPVRPYPGWAFLIIPLLRVFILRRKEDKLIKLADKMTVFGFFTAVMCTKLFPWKIFIQLLYRIQFAWRIMMISTVLLSVSCAIYALFLFDTLLSGRSSVQQLLLLFILCAVCGAPILVESLTDHAWPMDYYRYTERSNSLSGSEYLPLGLKREVIEKTGDHVISETPGFEMLSFVRKGLSVTWDYTLPEGSRDTIMRVPLIYYTGYRGYLTDADGTAHEIPVSKNDIGLITVSSGDVTSGRINVRYVKTMMQHIGDGISLTTVILCLFMVLKNKRASQRKRQI